MMLWHVSYRADRRALPLADAHYPRQKAGTSQFVPPAQSLVLLTDDARALWVSTWPMFAQHEWPGAWVCNLFRNESGHLSSEMIRQAVAATRAMFGEPTSRGMVTFVDASKVRHKRDPGRCFLKAGFERVGVTKERGRIVLQLLPSEMPAAELPIGVTRPMTLAV